MLSILLIGDENEQSDSFISKCDIIGVKALNKQKLPAFQAVPVELDQLMEAADAEVLHIIVAVIKELVDVGS